MRISRVAPLLRPQLRGINRSWQPCQWGGGPINWSAASILEGALVLPWGPCVGCVGPCAGLQALTERVGRVCGAVPALAGEGAREPPGSGRRGREPPSDGRWWHHQMEPSHLLGGEKTSAG